MKNESENQSPIEVGLDLTGNKIDPDVLQKNLDYLTAREQLKSQITTPENELSL
jgi:hypothetical protein